MGPTDGPLISPETVPSSVLDSSHFEALSLLCLVFFFSGEARCLETSEEG